MSNTATLFFIEAQKMKSTDGTSKMESEVASEKSMLESQHATERVIIEASTSQLPPSSSPSLSSSSSATATEEISTETAQVSTITTTEEVAFASTVGKKTEMGKEELSIDVIPTPTIAEKDEESVSKEEIPSTDVPFQTTLFGHGKFLF